MKEINIEIFYWKILKIGYYQKWNSRLTLKCQVGTTVRLTKLEKVGTEESDRKFVILVAQCLIVSSFKIIWKEDLFYIKWIIFEKIYFLVIVCLNGVNLSESGSSVAGKLWKVAICAWDVRGSGYPHLVGDRRPDANTSFHTQFHL